MRRTGAITVLLVLGALAAAPRGAGADSATEPIPILSGARIFTPGPLGQGYHGINFDPSSIGNFQGLVTLAYLKGRARDSIGQVWLMENDIRVFQGDYVSADGVQRRGTFAFL